MLEKGASDEKRVSGGNIFVFSCLDCRLYFVFLGENG